MLVELPSTRFELVRPLFTPITYHLTIESVLAGLTPSEIYVDDLSKPCVALIWWGTRIYLAGRSSDLAALGSLISFFEERFYTQAEKKGLSGYTLYYAPGWEKAIDNILLGKYPIAGTRNYYSLAAARLAENVQLGSDYRLLPVNAELLARDDVQNLAFVIEEMLSERPSVDDFLAKSFGFCVVYNKTIVAWCMSEYNYAERCEIGIMTAEEHRRKGLAKITATAVIDQAQRHGISQIGWHCWAHNKPSIATALSLNFELREVYFVVYGYFDEQVNLIVNGIVALNAGNVGDALTWFERARAMAILPTWAEEHVARAQKQAQLGV